MNDLDAAIAVMMERWGGYGTAKEIIVKGIAELRAACRDHRCPDDGSLDTVCWPRNRKCPARLLGGKP